MGNLFRKNAVFSLYDSSRSSGQASRLLRLLDYYAAQGVEVHYLSTEPLFVEPRENIHAHIINLPFKNKRGLIYWTCFTLLMPIYCFFLLVLYRPKLILYFETFYSLICSPLCLLFGVKRVLLMGSVAWRRETMHRTSPIIRLWGWLIDWSGIALSNLIVTPTEWMKGQVIDRMNLITREIAVVPFQTMLPETLEISYEEKLCSSPSWLSLADEQIDNKKRLFETFDVPDKTLAIALSGSRANRDDISYLLRTISALDSKKIVLFIYGDSKDKHSLLSLAIGLGLSQQVVFTGAGFSKDEVLSSVDLFLHSSEKEGMSSDLLEAFGYGAGVIAMDSEEMREILAFEECLLPRGDVGKCAYRLSSLSESREELNKCIQKSRKRAEFYFFDWAERISQTIST